MIWAIKYNQKIKASPNTNAICPLCNSEVISKCGDIKMWHWAHKNNDDCDTWYEPESEWHKSWKENFPKEQQEIVVGKHRADIKNSKGIVIELQNSSISSEEIKEREEFYKEMIWLLNGETIGRNLSLNKKENYFTFRWYHPPKRWLVTGKEIYIDLGDNKNEVNQLKKELLEIDEKLEEGNLLGYYYFEKKNILENKIKSINKFSNKLFLIKKIYHDCPCRGYGILLTKEEFLRRVK